MTFLNYQENIQGVGDIFLRDSGRYLAFVQLLDSVMTGTSELSHAQREKIALYVSRINHCHYCIDSHASVLNALGEKQVVGEEAVNQSIESADPKLQVLFAFVGKLSLEPGKIARKDIEKLRQAAWSDLAIEDVIVVTSTFAFLNRLVDGIGIKGNKAHFDQVGNMIGKSGYTPLVQMIQQKVTSS